MINDYGYEGVEFQHDPDMGLPKGEDWDDVIGKKDVVSLIFWSFLMFFYFAYR